MSTQMPVVKTGKSKLDQFIEVAHMFAPLANMILLYLQMRQSKKNAQSIQAIDQQMNGGVIGPSGPKVG